MKPVFDRLVWQKDRVLLENLVFRLEDHKDDSWELDDRCFAFYKTRRLMEQYRQLWSARPNFSPRTILELGMFDGGSLALWFEHFQPDTIVGVDLASRTDSDYFRSFVDGRVDRIKSYWGVDQTDRTRLLEIVNTDLGGTIDLVFDDASHLMEQTKASFKTIFPLVRTGGLYIIEDWSWALWPDLKENFLPQGSELPRFIFLLVEATGSMKPHLVGEGSAATLSPLIANLSVYPDFVVVERGPARVGELRVEDLITRSAQYQNSLQPPKEWWKRWLSP